MINKYSILLSLSKLIHELSVCGFIRVAEDLNETLYKLIKELEENNDEENQDTDDLSAVVNSVGLRGDTKPEEPWGGLTLEPIFFDSGDLRY